MESTEERAVSHNARHDECKVTRISEATTGTKLLESVGVPYACLSEPKRRQAGGGAADVKRGGPRTSDCSAVGNGSGKIKTQTWQPP